MPHTKFPDEVLQLHRAWLKGYVERNVRDDYGRLIFKSAVLFSEAVIDTDLTSSMFFNCVFQDCEFIRCDFSAAYLVNSVARGCRFRGCVFRQADLSDSDCAEVDFSGSNMTRVDLASTILNNAILDGCDLSWSSLAGADLRYASLTNTILDHAWFYKTKVFGVRGPCVMSMDEVQVRDILVDEEGRGPPQSSVEALGFLLNTTAPRT